jgi:hypothetical protein
MNVFYRVVLKSLKTFQVNMDRKFIEKVILIWRLFSIILENYFFHTSQAIKYQDASSCFDVYPILSVLLKKKRNYSSCMFWIELKQKIH